MDESHILRSNIYYMFFPFLIFYKVIMKSELCLLNEIKTLWPECIILHGRPIRHPQSQGSVEKAN